MRVRRDLGDIEPYQPGTPIEEAARRLGLDEIVKLASNETPIPPFPEVQRAVADAVGGLNRYPDNDVSALREAMSKHLNVDADRLWFGGGSASLIMVAAVALGGPGTSAVYGWPSFGLYRIASRAAHAHPIEVPLDDDLRFDLDAMAQAIRADTSIVYVCNPNNPTGTYRPADELFEFIETVPEDVAVVVDEAYFEYVQAPDYSSALPLALERRNVLVARTFSKVYGLAGLRVGYMVGDPDLIFELRRIQIPFSVNSLAQVAAVEALRHQDQVADRVQRNAIELKRFGDELGGRGYRHAPSVTNFVFFHPGERADALGDAMAERGVVVRPWSDGWLRVTVGTEAENEAFFDALDAVG